MGPEGNGNGPVTPRKRKRRGPSSPPSRRDGLLVDELCDEEPVSVEWVYRAIRQGHLKCRRYGRRIVVSRREFIQLGRRAAERDLEADF